MAHVERHHRKPCGRDGCAHGFAKHGRSAKGACTVDGCGCTRWVTAAGDRETLRARWRDPAGKEHAKTFTRKIDADRFLARIEGDKLKGSYVDPDAGRTVFRVVAERWYATTKRRSAARPSSDPAAAHPGPTTAPTPAPTPEPDPAPTPEPDPAPTPAPTPGALLLPLAPRPRHSGGRHGIPRRPPRRSALAPTTSGSLGSSGRAYRSCRRRFCPGVRDLRWILVRLISSSLQAREPRHGASDRARTIRRVPRPEQLEAGSVFRSSIIYITMIRKLIISVGVVCCHIGWAGRSLI
jgi:hypothetical protein